MEQYIPKSAVLAEIRKYKNNAEAYLKYHHNRNDKSVYSFEQEKLVMCELLSFLDTLETKEVDLMTHTIIAECCDWLAMTTNLSHDEIEGCRNLMLTVKEEQCKAQKGE